MLTSPKAEIPLTYVFRILSVSVCVISSSSYLPRLVSKYQKKQSIAKHSDIFAIYLILINHKAFAYGVFIFTKGN